MGLISLLVLLRARRWPIGRQRKLDSILLLGRFRWWCDNRQLALRRSFHSEPALGAETFWTSKTASLTSGFPSSREGLCILLLISAFRLALAYSGATSDILPCDLRRSSARRQRPTRSTYSARAPQARDARPYFDLFPSSTTRSSTTFSDRSCTTR